MNDIYSPPPELTLGVKLNDHLPKADQKRQRVEVAEILHRLRGQPGVILADEVGMGKTYVALGIAYSIAMRSPRGPVIIMVPPNLVEKWEQDLKSFCELYLENRTPRKRTDVTLPYFLASNALRYGVARHSIELMKFLDDPAAEKCKIIFLAQGAMGRRQTDKWTRLALIAETLRRHARGKASRLIQVKGQIHRFMGELLWAIGEERAHGGDELWAGLLHAPTERWKEIYNAGDQSRPLDDDPVPKAVARSLDGLDLSPLARALEHMPIRASGESAQVSNRLNAARKALREAEEDLWKEILARARWRSPLLVMDEAHHLKNPGTLLARQLQSAALKQDLCTGDGAMARVFDRMLFLTATPFQLGHHELVNVLRRFGDIKWAPDELGKLEEFTQRMDELGSRLDESQRTSIALRRSWSRLHQDDCAGDVDAWWKAIRKSPASSLTSHQRAVIDAFTAAKRARDNAENALRPWLVRYNKGGTWVGTDIQRRKRVTGAAISRQDQAGGLPIPPEQLLQFFLAARSAVAPGKDLLGEALCSSYEAFRFTREKGKAEKDEQEDPGELLVRFSQADWYLGEFDRALERCSGSTHPKVSASVRTIVDIWESGEKVLVFGFYLHTCRALRIHISGEIERRLLLLAQQRLGESGRNSTTARIKSLLGRIQNRYFDVVDSPGRRAIDRALEETLRARAASLKKGHVTMEQRETLADIMRRFLRVPTTLIRCFPIAELDSLPADAAVARLMDYTDTSGISWREKFDGFLQFITERSSAEDLIQYLDAASKISTGAMRDDDEDSYTTDSIFGILPNVKEATGKTRRDARARLMRAFNTPFFPEILVCSQVMGEGVDLQRFCRHVIHHDLDWNPSSIEQRTGRIDRIGCKAESKQPIMIYLPYIDGTADERQYRVMSDREQWFRIVMGQETVAQLIPEDATIAIPLPAAISDELSFKLGLKRTPS